nr:glycosyltransferase family 4 protein [Komagataeibacter swingsii]
MAILAIHMSERNDSVCNDVAYHYKILSSQSEEMNSVRIFSDNYDPRAFPDIPVESASAFHELLKQDPYITVLFHYCDSRTPFDEFLRKKCRRVIVRWHNATPPWFTFGLQNQSAVHALLGYENIIDFINCGHVSFWPNSEFTYDQLIALGATPERCHTVYPASRYLNLPVPLQTTLASAKAESIDSNTIDLLFVSRVVAHKGHINAIAVADRVQELTDAQVRLHIVGKGLDDPNPFSLRLRKVIKDAKAEIIVHGLVSDDVLINLYQTSDVFICLSEHEGFGLPVFEAMRYRLPVVAWATTAFRELLVKHPFAFPNFDLDLFASAINALAMPGVKSRLLEIQYAILQTYSAEIIETQVRDALAAQDYIWPQLTPADLERPAIRYLPRVACAIDTARKSLYNRCPQGFDNSLVFDSHINITSLYDIKMFRNYLLQDKELVNALTMQVDKPSITFDPTEFSMRKGVYSASIAADIPSLPSCSIAATHLIFGPYVQMPVGYYRAIMHVRITNESVRNVRLEIDIISGNKQLTSRVFALSQGTHDINEPVTFELSGEAPMVEIRLGALEPFKGNIVFSGATLIQTNTKKRHLSVSEANAISHAFWRVGLFSKRFPKRLGKVVVRQLSAARKRSGLALQLQFIFRARKTKKLRFFSP